MLFCSKNVENVTAIPIELNLPVIDYPESAQARS